MKKFSKLNVKLKDKSYPIFIGENLIKDLNFSYQILIIIQK